MPLLFFSEVHMEHTEYIAHLQGIVQIPTVSSVNDASTDWSEFDRLHRFLQEAYPLIFEKLEVTTIGKASLLFHWKSSHAEKQPIIFMAHQDVVPAPHEEQWSHPPFAGEIADGCLYGRGTEDCKSVLTSEMDAITELLEEGFDPDFDIYLSFGHDEEVQCTDDKKGSVLAAKYLEDHGVKAYCIFDEGGHVEAVGYHGNERPVALVGLAEKAPNEYVLYKEGAGGHASKPGNGTVLGDVARAIAAVEAHPMPYRLTPLVKAHLKALAESVADKKVAKLYAHPQKHWDDIVKLAKHDRELDAKLHTTFAVTMAEASAQANVLPSHAEATMSVRILQGDTVASVKHYLESIMPCDVQVKATFAEDPKPAGSVESEAYHLMSETIYDIFGKETLIVPNLMLGASDSRNYAKVSDNVFRFSGRLKTEQWGEAHQVDERMPTEHLGVPVSFFKAFLKKYSEK